VDNAEWLSEMKMIDYLRDFGAKFSVNKMLSAESVKQRLEDGISYLEFSYMILQACDFLHLNEKYNCSLQIGGQDQWGNIVAGTDIIRRFKATQAYGITVPLLLSSSGEKFGKTAAGAIWLSSSKTSDFDYYQFWRNIPDSDCGKMLRLFTELPEKEIFELERLEAPQLNRAKEILAFECTKFVRGEKIATESYLTAGARFGFADPDTKIKTSSNIINIVSATTNISADLPTAKIARIQGEDSVWIVRLFTESQLCSSSGEARRLIKGGGAYINGQKIDDQDMKVPYQKILNQETIIAAGRKNFKKIVLEN
jgi:tyrosyl-tRNA synthetase